ncbi:MAG TPA: MFS transporter [Dehalococcoidia bacterium]
MKTARANAPFDPSDIPTSGWRATFASLSVPQYSLYFYGMSAFFFGMNMMIVLRGYLVYQLTGSEIALSLIMLSVAVPMLVMAPIGGVIADRVDRRSLMIWAQVAVTALNLVNTVLIIAGLIEFWHLLVLSTASGMAFSFNMPARQAAIPGLVPRELLMNAMSLSTSSMNATRILAPAVGGLLIAPIGVGGGFAVLTAMYAIATAFTFGLPKMPPEARDAKVTFFSDFTGGFAYIRSNRLVLGLLLLGTIPMIFSMPYQTLLPVFAKDVWHVGPTGLGVLQAMAGVGGLAGALMVANMDRYPFKGRVMLLGAIGTGVFLMAFALSPTFAVALPMLALVGVGSMVFTTVNNTVITSVIPDGVRGRVMSVLMMSFGLMPLGAVPASIAAEYIGTPAVVAIGGGLLIGFVALAYVLFPQFRTLDSAIRIERADREAERDAQRAEYDRLPAAAGR